jgi:hypothetical protein
MKVRAIRRRAKTKYVSEEGFAFLRGCFAKRCRSYAAGCPTCDEWRFCDEHGRFTYNFDELRMYMDKTEREYEKVIG